MPSLALSLSLSLSLAHEWFSMAENGLLLPLQWRWMVFPGLPMVDGERGRKKGYSATTTNQCGKIILFSSPVPFLWFCILFILQARAMGLGLTLLKEMQKKHVLIQCG